MSRAKAQSLVDGVLARAEEVNLDPAWLYWVLEVGVYGSFAVESVESVGDVDVAVRLERRYEHDEHYRYQDEMIEHDQASPRSFLDLRNYARLKVLRHVRGRSSRVDLVEMFESDSLPPGAQLRVVYRYELPDP
jgi:predicted nucleotidyltransferase